MQIHPESGAARVNPNEERSASVGRASKIYHQNCVENSEELAGKSQSHQAHSAHDAKELIIRSKVVHAHHMEHAASTRAGCAASEMSEGALRSTSDWDGVVNVEDWGKIGVHRSLVKISQRTEQLEEALKGLSRIVTSAEVRCSS